MMILDKNDLIYISTEDKFEKNKLLGSSEAGMGRDFQTRPCFGDYTNPV